MSRNGSNDCCSRPAALKPARPQFWPGGVRADRAARRRRDGARSRPARSRHRSRRTARRRRRRDRGRPSCRAGPRRSWQARNCRSAVHCTNSTNSTSLASLPWRNARAFGFVRLPPLLRPFPPWRLRTCGAAPRSRRSATARRRARRGIFRNPARRSGVAFVLKPRRPRAAPAISMRRRRRSRPSRSGAAAASQPPRRDGSAEIPGWPRRRYKAR